MTKYTIKIINDLHEARIYTLNASTAENAEYKARILYKSSNCLGNITDVIVTERKGWETFSQKNFQKGIDNPEIR